MADAPKFVNYSLKTNSVVVLQTENRVRVTGPRGDPETLRGRLAGTFGDRAQPNRPQENNKKRKKDQDRYDAGNKRPKTLGGDILASGYFEGAYRPKTRETKAVHQQLLNFVEQFLGDVEISIIFSATDELLGILKADNMKPSDKEAAVSQLLGAPTPQDKYTELIRLGKLITDFSDDTENGEDGAGDDRGISVVIGDEDAEDDENYMEYEPAASDEDEDDGAQNAEEEDTDGRAVRTRDGEAQADAADELYIDPRNIDAYWLQREVKQHYADADQAQSVASSILKALGDRSMDDRECEDQLVSLLDYEHFELVKLFLHNRLAIVYATKYARASESEKKDIEKEMAEDDDLAAIFAAMTAEGDTKTSFERSLRREARNLSSRNADAMDADDDDMKLPYAAEVRGAQTLDLESLAFTSGAHTMTNKTVKLPPGSYRNPKKGYEEVFVPAVQHQFTSADGEMPITEMPEWSHDGFQGMKFLNRVQTKLYKCAFESSDNFLLCAPTGSGKTNVAMLAIMHEIGMHIDKRTKRVDLDAFKIVYIAPMKSLVQEMVHNFGLRLKPYGITVREMSGDASLTKAEVAETQVLVTTPEKWDIITRKSGDRTYTQLVRLVIMDEIHLLHDDRGPVLESIVARTIRQIESTQEMVRLVGLSATLPNYEDVATFLRVKKENVFAFPNSWRPVPLEQVFIGINVKKPFKRFQMMNELCYEKVIEQAGEQVLVFVHSRKETAKTARALRDMAMEKNQLGRFLAEDSASREILLSEAEQVANADLKDLLPYGFAIHHAGMTKADRTLVEDLFADKRIQVLVSTATLAWGVNLPAHAVIIKGTQVYSPDKGRWTELSPLDVMQMLGRAGRPQYDRQGYGCVITTQQELQFYLSLLTQQLPIESQLISRLADALNAELVLGTIQTVQDAVNWLGYTYLYVCMLRSPMLYGVQRQEFEKDRILEQRRYDLIHTAATLLAKHNLVKYDRKSGNLQITDIGRIASHYYISYKSMSTYNEHLKSTTTDIELLRVFSLSNEFQQIAVRPDERIELERLLERVPVPVKESLEEPSAKINVLLQAYISRLKLDGFSLVSDMVYVTQSASRIMRALFEIALRRGWAQVAEKCLSLCKMIDKRMWSTQSPLRQFSRAVPEEIIKKLEKKEYTLDRLYDLNAQELGELVRFPSLGKSIFKTVHQFPKLDLNATVQPITRNLLRVELTIEADFEWDEKQHGKSLPFWILVEDVDGESILHYEMFMLKQRYAEEEHFMSFTVPMFEPMPPQYFIKVVSDRWIGAESVLPVSFHHLILPERNPPKTELLDLQALPVSALKNKAFEGLYKDFDTFNAVQTQVFNSLYHTDANTLICAPTSTGKTICAEFTILREFSKERQGRIVYVAPMQALATERLADWSYKFKPIGKSVAELTGEPIEDLRILQKNDIVIATPDKWDMLSRRWRQRRPVQQVRLFIVDELHFIGNAEVGPTLEIICSRMRFIANQLRTTENPNPVRVIGLATSLLNAKDAGDWLGCTSHSLYNFHPEVRPVPLDIVMQGFDNPHFSARVLTMTKPLLYQLSSHADDKPVIIYVPSRKVARQVASDIATHCQAEDRPRRFLHLPLEELASFAKDIENKALLETLSFGVGFFHEGLTTRERNLVQKLFDSGAISVLIVTHGLAWGLSSRASLVVLMGTQFYEGKEHRYADYPITDVLQMVGSAGRQGLDHSAKCIVFCHAPKKEYYKKFIYDPLPVESHLDHHFHDHLNAEIVSENITSQQDAIDYITWTFFYRRLTQNPNFYNLHGTSHEHLSDHLSQLIEDTINDLVQAKCISLTDGTELSALNAGRIANYYYIRYTTIELFNFSLSEKTKMRGLIELLSNASEFEDIPIRHKEEKLVEKLAMHLPVKINKPDYHSPATKSNVLLQCHFSRRQLATDLSADQQAVLLRAPQLLQAVVDVISSSSWLAPALAAMELSQMIVQAMWDSDPVFKQLPHLGQAAIDAASKQCESIFDFLELDDKKRDKLLDGLSSKQKSDIARVCNRYPNITVTYSIAQEGESSDKDSAIVPSGENVVVSVKLEREDADEVGPVHAPFYPKAKMENWWLVVGETKTNTLYAIKRVSFAAGTNANLEFTAPAQEGKHNLTLYFISDSWMGCDQEYDLHLDVTPAIEGEDKMDED